MTSQSADSPPVEITLKTTTEGELSVPVTTEESIYTSAESLGVNLLPVDHRQTDVVSDTVIQPPVEVSEAGQMWSTGENQSSSLLLLESEHEGAAGTKGGLLGTDVQEEVELLAHQEQ